MELLRCQSELFAAQYNLKVYDITFRREHTGKVLRIYLDGAVTLEDCAAVSNLVSVWLDEQEESFLPYGHYQLEISSLGVDRPLRSAEELAAQNGELCRIQTKEKDSMGRKRYRGRITDVSNSTVTIYTEEEHKSFTIHIGNIAKANVETEI